MKRIFILLLTVMCISCVKQVGVTVLHPVDVEVEPSAGFDTLKVLWVSVREGEMTQDALAGYVSVSEADILLAMLPSSFETSSVVPDGMESLDCESAGVRALVASRRPLTGKSIQGDGIQLEYPCVEAATAGITYVVGALSDGTSAQDKRSAQARYLLDNTKYLTAVPARIFAIGMYAGEAACSLFSNASLVDCLKGQTCCEVPTSASGLRNEILWADSHAWGRMGLVSLDKGTGLSRYPLSFTVIVGR